MRQIGVPVVIWVNQSLYITQQKMEMILQANSGLKAFQCVFNTSQIILQLQYEILSILSSPTAWVYLNFDG